MRIHSIHVTGQNFLGTFQQFSNPICSICYEPVILSDSKTEEHGQAVHKDCYGLKLMLERATTPPLANNRQRRHQHGVQDFELHSYSETEDDP
jgi:hypothetical protein